ncbi:UNVERIFIED_CONTAM: hypothetical protein FKN15_039646 [Acipenser sinensis]
MVSEGSTSTRSALAGCASLAFAAGASIATSSISAARIALAGEASLFAASVGSGGWPPNVAATHGSIVAPVPGPGPVTFVRFLRVSAAVGGFLWLSRNSVYKCELCIKLSVHVIPECLIYSFIFIFRKKK